jgi:capsular exopolysaccharide synthesis family protein
MLVDKDKKVISFTSTVSGEGKSFCAANLAASIAATGKKTLVVGLDLRKPRLHHAFNMSNDIGVSTMLIGENTADEIILPTDVDNLWVALSGPIPPNPAELLGTAKMLDFVFYTKEQFEYIILDTPPIAIVTDALLLSNFCDINIYVVRQNYTNKNALKVIDELYRNKNVAHLTILMNDVNFSSSFGYKYGYGQGYGYGYKYGYGAGKGYFDEGNKSRWKKLKEWLNI